MFFPNFTFFEFQDDEDEEIDPKTFAINQPAPIENEIEDPGTFEEQRLKKAEKQAKFDEMLKTTVDGAINQG